MEGGRPFVNKKRFQCGLTELSTQGGFLYADAILAVTLLLLLMPTLLHMMTLSNQLVSYSYDRDYAMQYLTRHVEKVKASYRTGQVLTEHTSDSFDLGFEKSNIEEEEHNDIVQGLSLVTYKASLQDKHGERHSVVTYLFRDSDWK